MTDGIRLLALNDRDQQVDVTETFEPADDGFTGETMDTQKPSALAEAVFNLCRPGGQTPAAADVVAKAVAGLDRFQSALCGAPTPAEEKARAIRLAEEALAVAKRTRDLAERREWECEAALLELNGEQPLYAALLRARLSGDAKAHHRARVEFYADLFLRNSTPPPLEIADAVTERVAALRIERETH